MFYLLITIAFLLVLFTNLYWAIAFKDTEKKDKGFSVNSYELTYRRQFQRNLWNVPFVGILLFFIYSLDVFDSTQYLFIILLFLIVLVVQTIYTYRKWKKEEYNE